MRKILLLALLAGGANLVHAQLQGNGGAPLSNKVKYVQSSIIPVVKYNTPNIAALRAEDAIVDAEKSGPWRFAYNHMTNLNMSNSGSWVNVQNGGKIWRLKVNSKDALTLNFFLKDVVIPEGNNLFVYNEDKSFILGSFTDNHIYEGQLGTELIPGDVAILEYYVAPENMSKAHSLTVEMIGHGYRTADEYQEKAFGSSGNCNMNVNCPDGANWVNQRNSVAMLVSGGVNGSGFCTGALINNTANDGKPYFLTANHCYSNPAQWVFRFNWQATNCTNPNSSPTNFNSLSGATLRARRAASDFLLVEITGGLQNNTVPANFNPYFAGWDNGVTGHTAAVGIHHPAGDIKKISFDEQAPTQATYQNQYGTTTWRVVWDRNTTTEGGSSGSPLFNQAGNIIGQLWGGAASCNNLTGPDYYGGLWASWTPETASSAQLKFWLDPSNSGVSSIEGYDPNAVVTTYNAGILNILEPTNRMYCSATVSPQVTLKNFGSVALTSVQIIITANGNTVTTYNWSGNLAPNQTTVVNIPQITVPTGNISLVARTNNPNGQTDQQTGNDSATVSFTTSANSNPVLVTITTDCYGEETRWAITQQGSSSILIGGGNPTVPLTGGSTGYNSSNSNAYADQTTYQINTCLNNGCYTFTIADAYNDGMYYQNCSTQGSYGVSDGGSTNYVTMPTNQFGASVSHNFCINTSNVSTDELLVNSFNVYPNPSNGQITVTIDEQFNNSQVTVLDLTGRVVYTNTITSSTQAFDVSYLAKGKYIINIATTEGKVSKTIVLQ